MKKQTLVIILIITLTVSISAQKTIYEPLNLNEVKFSLNDFGSMWTFDAVPMATYKKDLNFTPTKEWLNHVQKSALQFGGGCSGAFVSQDGLIMTNHHCVRGLLWKVKKEGEDIHRDGFYAEKLEEERIIPDLYVDQLISIDDVTSDIFKAMKKAKTDDEKIAAKKSKIKEIVAQNEKETGLKCKVITLYNGGKYSLYSYKRYTDIRLVMVPDVQIAATGWDWDNFTYPRYELDFAFVRAYDENGKPVKVNDYFTWSEKGASEDEAIFVIGRPGNTDRMLSIAQLEYFKNYTHPLMLSKLNEAYQASYTYFQNHPESQAELLGKLLSVANGRKYYAGLVMALNDEYIMTKKRNFEKQLKEKVANDPKLSKQYGDLWNQIDVTIAEMEKTGKEFYIYRLSNFYASSYWQTARNLVEYAQQMQQPEIKRRKAYIGKNLQKTKAKIFVEATEKDMQDLLVQAHANFLIKAIGPKCRIAKQLYNLQRDEAALDYFIEATEIDDAKWVEKQLENPEEILNSNDPLIKVIINIYEREETTKEARTKAKNTLEVLNQNLGRVIFEVYGSQIPPDATSTLRISHGKIAAYEYNGTIAPGKSTYYGLYDRFIAFGGADYPWGLHERWKKPPQGLDLSIPMCFASNNDIVGGNSGSSIINTKGEVIGLVHDGNLESLAGAYIFLPENNRAVATDSWGLIEALKLVYKTERLVYELENSKMK